MSTDQTEPTPKLTQSPAAQPRRSKKELLTQVKSTISDDLRSGGQVRVISRWGEPVMHAVTRPVNTFDDELHTLIRDMFATMEAAEGVGLAATQVGVDLSVFVYDCPDDDEVRHLGVVCNPVLTLPEGRDRVFDATEEGCLSYPGAFVELARPDFAICRGQDETGQPIELTGTGLFARCLQHETDHLNGTVFGDRLSARARKKLAEQHDRRSEKYPDRWPVERHTDDPESSVTDDEQA